jgi:hypothetical protein
VVATIWAPIDSLMQSHPRTSSTAITANGKSPLELFFGSHRKSDANGDDAAAKYPDPTRYCLQGKKSKATEHHDNYGQLYGIMLPGHS